MAATPESSATPILWSADELRRQYAALATEPTTTDDVRKRWERPYLTGQQVNFIFYSLVSISDRLAERSQNERLMVSAFDRFTASLERLGAKLTNLDLHAQARHEALTGEQATLAQLIRAGLDEVAPMRDLIGLVQDDVLASDQYSAQAIEGFSRLQDAIHALPPVIRSALELSLASASMEPHQSAAPSPAPIVLASRAVAAD